MLTEERFALILDLLYDKKAVTVTELTKLLGASESTIRRDLNTLNEMGKIKKVHGGATVLDSYFSTKEDDVVTKSLLNTEAKSKIAKYASTLVHDDDFIFIDAGTTTEKFIDYIPATNASFVTTGIAHARKLVQKGLKVYVTGGQLKSSTEALVGIECVNSIVKYNFSKCFMGTNGISEICSFTTPDPEEALIKREAIRHSYVSFVLADNTKFNKVCAVTFAELKKACIITDKLLDNKYRELTVVREVL